MKKIVFYVLAYCVCSMAYSQKNLTLIVEDDAGRKDTVYFGDKNNATIGIDTSFGEKNIFDQPCDSLEIRSILRDSTNHNCLAHPIGGKKIYAIDNIDTKIDYRSILSGSSTPFSSIPYNYEFLICGHDFPIKISGDFRGLDIFDRASSIHLLDSSCSIVETVYPAEYFMEDIITINNPNFKTLILHLEYTVGINDNKNNHSWQLAPNPTPGYLEIQNLDNPIDMVTIIDTKGNIRFRKEVHGNNGTVELEIGHLKDGIYIVHLWDLDSGDFSMKMLQKISQ